VVPLVFGLLLSPDPAVREAQLAALGEPAEPLTDLHPMLRLPLAELAFPLPRGPVEPAPTRPLADAERRSPS
jgi:hypothetical protein